MKNCSICKREYEGWGNNPAPFACDRGERCCDDCNDRLVVPARMMRVSDPKLLDFLVRFAQLANSFVAVREQMKREQKKNPAGNPGVLS